MYPVAGYAPPGYGGPGTGFGYPGSFRGSTVHAVGDIRKGMSYYRIYLVLTLVAALLLAGSAVVSNTPQFEGGSIPSSIWNGNNTSQNAPVGSTGTTAFALLAGLAGFVGIIVLLVSWITWRRGVRELAEAGAEYGPVQSAAAEAAERDYSRTVWTFIAAILASIALAIAVVVIALSIVTACLPPATCVSPTAQTLASLRNEIIATILVATLIGYLFNLLAYHFSSRSLVGSIRSIAGPVGQAALDGGRRMILLGAVLGFVAVLSILYVPLAFLEALPPILLLIGFTRLIGAYDGWLEDPPPSGPNAASALR